MLILINKARLLINLIIFRPHYVYINSLIDSARDEDIEKKH